MLQLGKAAEVLISERIKGAAQLSKIATIFRSHFITGLLVLLPVTVTFIVLRFLFHITASVLAPIIRSAGFELSTAMLNAISIASLFLLVYIVGLFATNIFGQRIIGFGERLISRVPLVKIIYSGAKDVVGALSMQGDPAFKKIVLVEHPRKGMYALGFVTGDIKGIDGKSLLKVFIPTSPNPTSGFFQLVPPHLIQETDMALEEAVKTLVSAGALAPECLHTSPSSDPISPLE